MILNFSCRCHDAMNPDRSAELVNDFMVRMDQVHGCGLIREQGSEHEGESPTSSSEEAGDASFEFAFQLKPACGGSLEGQATVIEEIVGVLAELSDRHRLRLSLGHQMEPLLGRIAHGIAEPGLIEELQTSLRVAVSLREMTLEESHELEGLEGDLPDESPEQWSTLLDNGETFQRFPPWDD